MKNKATILSLSALALVLASCASPRPPAAPTTVKPTPAVTQQPAPVKVNIKPSVSKPTASKTASKPAATSPKSNTPTKPPTPADPASASAKPTTKPAAPTPPPITATPINRPSPSVAPKPASASTHIIRPGDTLSKLASHYGITETAIKSANSLQSDILVVGTSLRIPAK